MSTADRPPDSPGAPATVAPALGKVAAHGMAWTTLAVFLGRVTGFAAHLVLGWLLTRQDFGVYAIANALSVIVLTVRSSGLQKLLIQRGSEFEELAQPVARLSFVANLIGCVILLVIAPLGAQFYGMPVLVPLMSIIAISMPLSVPAEVIRARLSVELRFRDLAIVNALTMVSFQTLVVVLAWADMGPFSFVIPLIVITLLESIALTCWVGWWPKGRQLDRRLVSQLFGAMKWIMLCGFAGALIVYGTHLVVGKLEPPSVTGTFSFGFNLTTSVAIFFNAGMQRVLMPLMSQFSNESERVGQAYLKAVRTLVAVASPVCFLGVVLAAPMMHFLWQGKWDDAIPIVVLLGTALPIYLLTGVGAATLEGRGLWRDNTLLHFASGLGTLVAAWIGATSGGLVAIAWCAGAFRLSFGIVHGMIVASLLGQDRNVYLATILPPFAVSASCAAATYLTWHQLPLVGHHPLIAAIGLGCVYVPLIIGSYWLLLPNATRELMALSPLKTNVDRRGE